jgi:hypothetical protein
VKKIIALLLALSCVLGLVGCSKADKENEATPPTGNVESTIATENNENTSTETTEDLSEIPGGTRFIVEIHDRAKEEQLACAEAEELFYEDETNRYYFNVIKSHYIMVTYNNGNSEDIVTALNAGRATIADLDEFGIEYHTEPTVAHTLDCKSLQEACAESFIDPSKVTVLGGEWAYTSDPNKFVALATVRYTDKDDEYVTAEIVMVGTFGGKTELFHHLNEHSPYTRENALREFGAVDDRRFPLE